MASTHGFDPIPGADGRLIAILTNPPLTRGDRTRARVDRIRSMLGHESAEIVNLFPEATHRTGAITRLGSDEALWVSARPSIESALTRADSVLLGYGLDEPAGAARSHHRAQVRWLHGALRDRRLPVYVVGEGPRHPSRWQRYTSRRFPDVPFEQALSLSLKPIDMRPTPPCQ